MKNQVNVIIHQLRNPLAALRTYAKLLIKRLGSDDDSIEIVERMIIEQKQINKYMDSIKTNFQFLYFFILMIMHPFYIVIFGSIAPFTKVQWK